MQSLIIHALLIPLLRICELHGAQLDKDKSIVYLFSTESGNFSLKI